MLDEDLRYVWEKSTTIIHIQEGSSLQGPTTPETLNMEDEECTQLNFQGKCMDKKFSDSEHYLPSAAEATGGTTIQGEVRNVGYKHRVTQRKAFSFPSHPCCSGLECKEP